MKHRDLVEPLGLDQKDFQLKTIQVPIIESSLYTNIGRRLFEIYSKYEITSEDQRNLERLSFLLVAFTHERAKPKGLWTSLKARIKKKA